MFTATKKSISRISATEGVALRRCGCCPHWPATGGVEKNGQPIGPYDEMIAGHARSLGLIVVTNNVKQFQSVTGLRIENWVR